MYNNVKHLQRKETAWLRSHSGANVDPHIRPVYLPSQDGSAPAPFSVAASAARSCYSFAMSWIFNKAATDVENPWSDEWGSPNSFAGPHPGHYPRYNGEKTPVGKSSPPAAPAHYAGNTADSSTITYRGPINQTPTGSTFRTAAEFPQALIDHGRAADRILMRYHRKHSTFVGAEVYIESNVRTESEAESAAAVLWPTYVSVDPWPMAQIEHDRDGDEDLRLWNYYNMRGTFRGAKVYIKPNGKGDAPAPDVDAADLMPHPWTFFSPAKYPTTKIAYSFAGDDKLWRFYKENNSFNSAQVYIEPNTSGGVCFRTPAATAHDVDAQNHRPTYISAADYPRAVIQCAKPGDDMLQRYFEDNRTFVGATVHIAPGYDLGDDDRWQ